MEILQEGQGELVGWFDPDDNRAWIQEHKSRELVDKRMTITEAVERFIPDGAFLASGGFGHVRVSMIGVYEIIRQGVRNLTMAGKTAVHDADLLIAAGCVNRTEVAYSFGHEIRGLSPASRAKVESGECQVTGEISNAGYQWRFLAAMMGVPFIPTRTMLGTDTLKQSSAKVIQDPWSGKPICLLPACYPDVAMIHVHRCDIYGNAQIDGILVEDFELARAARRLILTTEKIIPTEEIRCQPCHTVIPFYLVDAVVVAPYGSHPCHMPYEYYFDDAQIRGWLKTSKTEAGVAAYLQEYVYGVDDFAGYLEKVGGEAKMQALRRIELLQSGEEAENA